ncbi:short chain dehydrogenase/ reductase [Aspergillus steynii IBT 23096]|uniref:Short chain dehydrogenase/ reductase n=1 Tax=Aspergillus steynii IBT 23096 TaxID=1392250 RepID=A0A2I2FZV3_9EURO|nr:short chain dehydrogenase/ reductase [Aspergillus steynii IBT 23096]PLB46106.1 short chain dehydrogenase/ reductase [Aspergillus steynii IBT 23096]
MTHQVQGTAFITGAASGIAASTAHNLSTHGISNLALADIDESGLSKIAAELTSTRPDLRVLVLPFDVSSEDSVTSAIRKTAHEFGRIDIGVNCAGVAQPVVPTHETSRETWNRVVGVNQTGVWLCQRELVRVMLGQEHLGPRLGRGVIVNVSSSLGVTATDVESPLSCYVSSKHAIVGLTRTDGRHYAKDGIRINALCPGWVATPLIQPGIDAGNFVRDIEALPIGRVGQVEEIADTILYMVSPMSSFMVGAALVVDGGYSL